MPEKRLYRDRAEYLIQAVAKRRKTLRRQAIALLGGCCQQCGYCRYEGALEFHHQDSRRKDFGLSASGLTRSWAKIKLELEKCILLCANCHREVHGQIMQPLRRKSKV